MLDLLGDFQRNLDKVRCLETERSLLTVATAQPNHSPDGHKASTDRHQNIKYALVHHALSAGVFDWLQQQGRVAALIRQISNPMAGVDTTLLALAGTGFSARRAFGFMSCERVVGAAEGMNVLQVRPLGVTDRL